MSTERAYTVREIGDLRKATRQLYHLYSHHDAAELEERVRTFMVAGVSPNAVMVEAILANRPPRRPGQPRPPLARSVVPLVDWRKITKSLMREERRLLMRTVIDDIPKESLTKSEHDVLNMLYNELLDEKVLSNG